MQESVERTIRSITEKNILEVADIERAKQIYRGGTHVILSRGREKISLQIEADEEEELVEISELEDGVLASRINGNASDWESRGLAALYVIDDEFKDETLPEGVRYTRQGMIKRVMDERRDKARKAEYKVELADNLYGEHSLFNEKGKEYKITLWDFEAQTGYIDNIDWRVNKLGTTKHIMYLYDYMAAHPRKVARLDKTFPFIEVYTDPMNEYRISWYFPEELGEEEKALLDDFFGDRDYIDDSRLAGFFSFFHRSRDLERIKVRPEVFERVEAYFERRELEDLRASTILDYSGLKADLYPYQKEGVAFSVFKKGVIIADEMGLGKTLQAIATAVIKKEVFGFKKTLVICPASVKSQWRDEVRKFTDEEAKVVEGRPEERKEAYLSDPSFFHIINYETVLRDLPHINEAGYDFVILDEAQKIKNYETKTAMAVKAIKKKHGLVITGTPLENKLLDLYSIVQFLDQQFFAPQWEFSYQHCIFDVHSKNKIRGYYDLHKLKDRLQDLLIRREKKEVFDQLPNVVQQNIIVQLSDEQAIKHAGYSRGISAILAKKFKTNYDWQKLMHLLTNMRMVCDSTFLVDKSTHCSPKMVELRDILINQLNIKNDGRKVIIFSEWVVMLDLIGKMLSRENITHAMLSGKVPVKKRGALIKNFEEDPECKILLSSEAGGAGLNLQFADTVINFELPWNPAKKNQRIGRIDRIGQKKQKLHVFNLLSQNSIEMKIAAGIVLKQDLFEGVLNTSSTTEEVDFSAKGKSQFLKQLEEVMKDERMDIGEEDITSELDHDEEQELEELISEVSSAGKQTTMDLEIVEQEGTLSIEEEETPHAAHVATDTTEEVSADTGDSTDSTKARKKEADMEQMEEVMTKGMEFLTGIFKMSTGSDLGTSGKPKVKVDKETGEVSISFKIGM